MHFDGRGGAPQDFVPAHKWLNLKATLPHPSREADKNFVNSARYKRAAVDAGHRLQKKLDRQTSRLAGAPSDSFPGRAMANSDRFIDTLSRACFCGQPDFLTFYTLYRTMYGTK